MSSRGRYLREQARIVAGPGLAAPEARLGRLEEAQAALREEEVATTPTMTLEVSVQRPFVAGFPADGGQLRIPVRVHRA